MRTAVPASAGHSGWVKVVGEAEPALHALLADVLADVPLAVSPAGAAADEAARPPRVILAIGDRARLDELIGQARQDGRGVPVVAVLPLFDERDARQAIAAGAAACCALDAPLGELTDAVRQLLGAPRPGAPRGGSRP
jgi:hypothetical protein